MYHKFHSSTKGKKDGSNDLAQDSSLSLLAICTYTAKPTRRSNHQLHNREWFLNEPLGEGVKAADSQRAAGVNPPPVGEPGQGLKSSLDSDKKKSKISRAPTVGDVTFRISVSWVQNVGNGRENYCPRCPLSAAAGKKRGGDHTWRVGLRLLFKPVRGWAGTTWPRDQRNEKGVEKYQARFRTKCGIRPNLKGSSRPST